MPEALTVTERMQVQLQQWENDSDRRAVFLSCYRLMTNNMLQAIQASEFHDREWVDNLLNHFAGYYFNALEAYEQASPRTPEVWQIAYDAARQPKTEVLQNLMLGVNAHINYDLVLALVDMLEPEWAQLSEERRQQRYADHCHVNEVIGRTVDSVQASVVEPLEPALEVVDELLGPIDEWMTSKLLTHWRDMVWKQALSLIESDSQQRERLRQQVEIETLRRAQAILLKDGLQTLTDLI
jgi:hypothetical protein